MEEDRLYQASKSQESSKIQFDRPYLERLGYHTTPVKTVDVEEDVTEKYLSVNSPYTGVADAENHDVLVRPQSNLAKHEKEHIGKVNSSKLARSVDHAGNVDEYAIDDKGLVKMRKYYGHKKDRTTRAPKENKLTTNSTIDNTTRLLLLNLINNGYFDELGGQIQTGKEGTVFSAVRGEGEEEEWFCVKVYKVLTMEFRNKKDYIYGDHRFVSLEGVSGGDTAIVDAWTRKEHFNLLKLHEAEIPCPEPILYEKNVLLMRMIGDGDTPAPALRDVVPGHRSMYRRTIYQCAHLLRDMFQKCKLIHGDFSEYNLLWGNRRRMMNRVSNGIVYVIDVGQSVNTTHTTWEQLLERDVSNILNFYNHHGAISDLEEVKKRTYEYVLAEETETVTSDYDTYLSQHI
ncbi:hypothetical protein WA538_001603, partial [Blastocystis sp. DL]